MGSAEARPNSSTEKIGAGRALGALAVLDALPVAVYATNAEGIIVYCNRAAAELAGRQPQIGQDRWCVSWRLLWPDGSPLPHDECPMARTLKEGRPIRGMEVVAVRPDESTVLLMPHPTPIFDESGALAGGVNVLVDFSGRRSAAPTSDYLAAVAEASDDAIVARHANGIITGWNPGAERLFGYPADEAMGRSITILTPAGYENEEPEIRERSRGGERIERYETKRRRKDGTLIDVALTVCPVRDAEGQVIGASEIIRDITESKRAGETLATRLREQAALHVLTERLQRVTDIVAIYEAALDAIQTALNCSRASILLFDAAAMMRFVAWRGLSERYRQAVDGHSPWTADARDPEPIFVEDIASAEISDALRQAIVAEGIGAVGFIPLVAEGKLIGKFMTYYDAPHGFADTEISVALTIARQLGFSIQRMRTEQAKRQAEEQLRRNEASERARAAELVAIMEAAPALIWIARTPDCRVIGGNRCSYEMLRLPPDSNLSLSAPPGERPGNFRVFVAGRELPPEELPLQRAARGEEVKNFEEEIRFDDGTSRYVFGNATPLRDAAGEVIGAVAASVDITERKQTEEALQNSERRLQIALGAGRMGAWEWNLDSGQVIWSPGLEALHHREPGTFGGTLADFKQDVHPEDLALIERELASAIETRGDYHCIYRITTPDGAIRWMEAFGQFSPRSGSSMGRLTGVCMDITERKEAEAQRNMLVAELSHRVKNTLAIVSSISRQTYSTNPDAHDAHRSFDARIRALAQTHTRLAEASWSGVSLETVLSDELAPYHNNTKNNVALAGPPTKLPPKHALTLGMAAHELATNAAKHGALSVKSGNVEVGWTIAAGDRLQIRWSEAGGPPVLAPTHNGFGRLLLERVVASDLGGEVHLEFAPQGLICTIDVPYPLETPR